jgi:hypothetical protein
MIGRLLIAGVVFWIGFDGGSYDVTSRHSLAIAVFWGIVVAVVAGLWPAARLPWPAIAAGALLLGYAAMTAASIAWADSAGGAFVEFDRVLLYVGVLAVVVLGVTQSRAPVCADGMALGITALGLFALATRLFPGLHHAGTLEQLLPETRARLSYPVNYWNGLSILVALAFPLLLRVAVAERTHVWRALALAPFPALAATMYLTSSRGGAAVALVATVAFVALAGRRWTAAAAVVVAAGASAAAVAVVGARTELANGSTDTSLVTSQGRSAALLIGALCVACGLAWWLALRYAAPRLPRPSRRVGLGVTGALVLGTALAILLAHPVRQLDTFRAPPPVYKDPDFILAHLSSANGSGRWQFWTASIDEFRSSPWHGRGAGSFEAWWAQHGSISFFVRDAHSLYVEALGELGVIGFALITGAVLVGIVTGSLRALRRRGAGRETTAAFAAVFIGYALGAGIDWMWELTVVSVIGVATLGLVTGPATDPAASEARAPVRVRRKVAMRAGVATVAVVAGVLVIGAEAIPLLNDMRISESQAAVRRGDPQSAISRALAARRLEPWDSTAYLQLALIEEQEGRIGLARGWIGDAIQRDRTDWRLWLVRARLETKAGAITAARKSLREAARLNPRSPLLAGLKP